MPARNDRAAPPPPEGGFEVRFARKAAADGWEQLCRAAPGPMRMAYDYLSTRPYQPLNPSRQHPLQYDLKFASIGGKNFRQWQYEVTGAGRIWYAVNEPRSTTWVTHASVGHPSKTDK